MLVAAEKSTRSTVFTTGGLVSPLPRPFPSRGSMRSCVLLRATISDCEAVASRPELLPFTS